MSDRQLNMREVAREAEVSVATVSRALRAPDKVSSVAAARVQAAVARLGYVYNAAAGDVTARRSTVLGVLVPTAGNALFGETLNGIQDVALAAGYSIIQGATRYDPRTEEKLIDTFLQRRVHGLILTGLTTDMEQRIPALAREAGVRAVVVWEKPQPGPVSYVGVDNHDAARRATAHLIALGHRRIGLIVGPQSRIARARHRLEGYRSALEAAGLPYDPALVIERRPEPVEGRAAMHDLMALDDAPTAVFAASDPLAFGAMRAAHDAGLRIPQDVSIVGFDDLDLAAYMHPPLTTVRVDGYRIGRLAAQILIDPADETPRGYCLDSDLVVRGSTGPVRERARPEGAGAPPTMHREDHA